jgi:hypothetical protein
LSGSIDDWTYQYRNGKTYIGKKAQSTKDPSDAMLDQRDYFTEAAAYGNAVKDDPIRSEFYAPIAEERGQTIYLTAMTDFLTRPTIKPLNLSKYRGQVGDIITIRAKDDIGLATMDVALIATDGTQIEGGKAVETYTHSGKWIYTATTAVAVGTDIFIEVVGADHAGTEVKLTESPRVGVDE